MSWKTSAAVRCLRVNPYFHHSAMAAPAIAIPNAVQPASNGPFSPSEVDRHRQNDDEYGPRALDEIPKQPARPRCLRRNGLPWQRLGFTGRLPSRPREGCRPQERREQPADQAGQEHAAEPAPRETCRACGGWKAA